MNAAGRRGEWHALALTAASAGVGLFQILRRLRAADRAASTMFLPGGALNRGNSGNASRRRRSDTARGGPSAAGMSAGNPVQRRCGLAAEQATPARCCRKRLRQILGYDQRVTHREQRAVRLATWGSARCERAEMQRRTKLPNGSR